MPSLFIAWSYFWTMLGKNTNLVQRKLQFKSKTVRQWVTGRRTVLLYFPFQSHLQNLSSLFHSVFKSEHSVTSWTMFWPLLPFQRPSKQMGPCFTEVREAASEIQVRWESRITIMLEVWPCMLFNGLPRLRWASAHTPAPLPFLNSSDPCSCT